MPSCLISGRHKSWKRMTHNFIKFVHRINTHSTNFIQADITSKTCDFTSNISDFTTKASNLHFFSHFIVFFSCSVDFNMIGYDNLYHHSSSQATTSLFSDTLFIVVLLGIVTCQLIVTDQLIVTAQLIVNG